MTTMSTTKAPMSVVARLFVLSLEGTTVNWYHGLEKSIRDDWKELYSTFLKQYEYNTKLEVSIRDLELSKQSLNESFLDFLTRFMNKAGLMKNKLAEKDQVSLLAQHHHPNLQVLSTQWECHMKVVWSKTPCSQFFLKVDPTDLPLSHYS